MRPIPWAIRIPGAAASIIASTLSPRRFTTIAPTETPKRMPPQMPRPPSQIAKGAYHSGPSWS